jgi:hypothetical protein
MLLNTRSAQPQHPDPPLSNSFGALMEKHAPQQRQMPVRHVMLQAAEHACNCLVFRCRMLLPGSTLH